MNRHYDNYLVKKYPKLFKNRYAPMTQTCMCWGFECGSGWFNIINQLCRNIQNHINNKRNSRASAIKYNRALRKWEQDQDDSWLKHYYTFTGQVNLRLVEQAKSEKNRRVVPEYCQQVVVDQVKEKFGSLRFYYHGGDDEVYGMVRMAESMSAVTCEVCGNKGKISGGGWLSCRCEEHRK